MKKVKSIHFVGIKGVGLTPLAVIAKEAGIEVTGSDIADEFITDATLKKVGITPLIGFAKEHVGKAELVITTGAHGGYDNIEVIHAKELGISVLTRAEAVGEFMKGEILGRNFQGISIAGSHGKTTTTAMLVTLLQKSGIDASYLVGTSDIGGVELPGHLGKAAYFVAEADEYATEPKHNHKAAFLWQSPSIILFTNIELDHTDIYKDVEAVEAVFTQFAETLPENGVLIGCGDDERVYRILKKISAKTVSYGLSPKNDYVLERVHVSGDQTFFHITAFGTDLGEFMVRVTGEHNALNATGAVVASLEVGLPLEKIKKSLATFSGTKRRLEYRGQLQTGAYVFDDYAHHPTEIKKTLQSLRQRYVKEQIICIFQPHTYSRTKTLYDDFLRAFSGANKTIITDIYASLREEKDPSITAKKLAEDVARQEKDVLYIPTASDVVEYLGKEKFSSRTVIVFMGAGDIYKAIDSLNFQDNK